MLLKRTQQKKENGTSEKTKKFSKYSNENLKKKNLLTERGKYGQDY